MLELQPDKTFRGAWDEVAGHLDEIPSNAVVEIGLYALNFDPNAEVGDFGGRTIGDVYGHLFGTSNFGPPDLAERAGEYSAERGFGETQDGCDQGR